MPDDSEPIEQIRDIHSARKQRGLFWRILRELRAHRLAYAVLVIFTIAGPFLVPLLFPEASPAIGLAGGLALGVIAALSAVPDQFF